MFGSLGWTMMRPMRPEAHETHVGPRLAAVDGLVDSVAEGNVAPDERLSGPGPDLVRVGRSDGEGAYRLGRLMVEDRSPVRSSVFRLPDASGAGSGEVNVRVVAVADDRAHAVALGSDEAPVESVEIFRRDRGGTAGALGAGFRRRASRRGHKEDHGETEPGAAFRSE